MLQNTNAVLVGRSLHVQELGESKITSGKYQIKPLGSSKMEGFPITSSPTKGNW